MNKQSRQGTERLNIAVIGSGISGLSAAWLLNQAHDVTVFEKNNYIGGHSHTVVADDEFGRIPIDTCFIVYNEMKGEMSAPLSQLYAKLNHYLYPTTTYHFNSGGDPKEFPLKGHQKSSKKPPLSKMLKNALL